jgi:hypothetical protein
MFGDGTVVVKHTPGHMPGHQSLYEFRKLALALPEAIEQSHMNHPDFRGTPHPKASPNSTPIYDRPDL